MRNRRLVRWDHRELAAEIVRRAGACSYVIHVDDPPTATQRIQLTACRLLRRPVTIMPARCLSTEEWVERYAPIIGGVGPPNRVQAATESGEIISAQRVACDEERPHWPPLRVVASAPH